MSGQIVGQIVGTVIGFTFGGPIGGFIGGGIGSAVGSSFDTLPTQYGPRLDDLRAQRSEYGAPLPIVYGTIALQGNVIWAQDIKEVKTETEQGGKGGPSQTTVTYSYFGNFAVAICEGPIGGVLRIWAGPEKRLIYDGVALEGGNVRFYLGTEVQTPDPLIEADKGVGLAPAYRGTAYAVFEDLPLLKDGNRLPFLTFEVTTGDDGGTCGTDYTMVGDSRLYDVPPVKLGNYGSGPVESDARSLSFGAHPYAADSQGNLYFLNLGLESGVYRWYLKKVSSNSSLQESELYLGDEFNAIFACSIAYNPNTDTLGVIQEHTTHYLSIDCASFTGTYSALAHPKSDIIFSENEQRFRMLNTEASYTDGQPDADNYGLSYSHADQLIECGPHGIVVRAFSAIFKEGTLLVDKACTIYDPVRDRLLAVGGYNASGTGYYDFATGEVLTPVDMAPTGVPYRLNATYFPLIDRIIWNDAAGLLVMNPADFTAAAFPDECKLFEGQMLYADGSEVAGYGGILTPIPIPGQRNRIAVVNGGNWNSTGLGNDIYTFTVGVRGKSVTLASVVADLSERAGEPRYDVSALEADVVDGYAIARQSTVRSAIDTLRTAYYFDAVESQGTIRFVKRGGAAVAVIDDAYLGAHDAGSEKTDPLQTVRRMENELPRAVTVKYLLAATDYDQATKQARRLIGASGDEQTIEVPLVLTDTKAQEVAEVSLHAAWAERLSYSFTLPRRYSHLEPTDLIVVKGHLMRLTKVKATPRGVLQCEAVADESTYYAPHVVVTETQPTTSMVAKPGVTLMELF